MNPIVKYVQKQLFAQKGAIANRKAVDFSVAKMAERLSEFGFDPRLIKDEKQLIQVLNLIKEAEDKAFAQRFGDMLRPRKSAKVFSIKDKKEIPNPERNIMGGQAFETEEEIAKRITKENQKGLAKIRARQKMLEEAIDDASPGFANDTKVDAELVAENLAERMGLVYDDLPTKQRLDLYDQAYTGLSKQRFKNMKKPIAEGLSDKEFKNEKTSFRLNIAKNSPEFNQDLAKKITNKEIYTDLSDVQREEFLKDLDFVLKNPRDGNADGGRIGFKNGLEALTLGDRGFSIKPKKRTINIEGVEYEIPVDADAEIKLPDSLLEKLKLQRQIREKQRKDRGLPESIELMADGGRIGFNTGSGLPLDPMDPDNKLNAVINAFKKLPLRSQNRIGFKKFFKIYARENFEDGGRIGFKMGRRAFLKALGAGIGGAAAIKTGIIGLGTKKAVTGAGEKIITAPVKGKPEWFDALVNKVIREGDDVTKQFSTKEREIVHKLDIDNLDDVRVTQDLDQGMIKVEYNSPNNMGEDTVELVFKSGRDQMDETTGKVADEFYAVEKEPRAVGGPEDADLEFDGENFVRNVDDLQSDTSKLKQIATGKKQTLSEFVNSKKKKDRVKSINEDQVEQAEYLETKYGPYERYLSEDVDADFASGGLAGMLGQ